MNPEISHIHTTVYLDVQTYDIDNLPEEKERFRVIFFREGGCLVEFYDSDMRWIVGDGAIEEKLLQKIKEKAESIIVEKGKEVG